ncbi:MAG TPA: hypothetical protein VK096_06410 [Actinomycetales bacterium]|nr:hypothetical protein [Actinomycetales bacterium]
MLGLRKLGAAALLAVLALAGCSSAEGTDVEPTQALPDKPVKIDSLKELSGATKYATNGVSLQIPDQMEILNEEIGGTEPGDVTQVSFALPGADRASIILTIEPMPSADEKNAEFSALAMENTININGVGSDIEKSVLDWPDLGPGAALSANLQVEFNGVETERETFTAIVAVDDVLVSVSAETEMGELEDSDAMQALRTLRIEPDAI